QVVVWEEWGWRPAGRLFVVLEGRDRVGRRDCRLHDGPRGDADVACDGDRRDGGQRAPPWSPDSGQASTPLPRPWWRAVGCLSRWGATPRRLRPRCASAV